MQQYQPNPFACDLNAACDAFFQQLGAVQRWSSCDYADMQHLVEERDHDLATVWANLAVLAQAGLEAQVATVLTGAFQDYAQALALRQYLRTDIDPWALHEGTPGLQTALREELTKECARVSALLQMDLSLWKRKQETEVNQAGSKLAHTFLQLTEQGIEREYTRNQELYNRSLNLLNQREHSLSVEAVAVRNANADARDSLRVALDAAKEVRETSTTFSKHAGEFMTRAQEYAEYNAPAVVARAIHNRKVASRFVFVTVLGLLIIVVLIGVYIGITHLY